MRDGGGAPFRPQLKHRRTSGSLAGADGHSRDWCPSSPQWKQAVRPCGFGHASLRWPFLPQLKQRVTLDALLPASDRLRFVPAASAAVAEPSCRASRYLAFFAAAHPAQRTRSPKPLTRKKSCSLTVCTKVCAQSLHAIVWSMRPVDIRQNLPRPPLKGWACAASHSTQSARTRILPSWGMSP